MAKAVLGIDVGGSTTKIVGFRKEKEGLALIPPQFVRAADPITSIYGAFGKFTLQNDLSLSDIDHIMMTGVGSTFLSKPLYDGLDCRPAPEFDCVGRGGLYLAGLEEAIVVSMGTGTSFLWANKGGEIRHLIGSGVGGGTLAGLSSLTTGVHQYALIRKLCQDGDLSHIDLTMADLSREQVGDLPPEATAANFAKVADDATPSDKMLGIVNLVLQSIGTMSVLACKCCGTDTVVLTGALTMLPPARETFELFKQLYHVNFIIPENATFATAIGAALYSVREN